MRILAALLFVFAPIVANAGSFSLSTSERRFEVTSFQISGTAPRPAVLILGGAKGYKAKAYAQLSNMLHAEGIDVFWIHYMSDNDIQNIERAGSAPTRKALYEQRMSDWRETITATLKNLRNHPYYKQSKIGGVGVSLGVMPLLSEASNSFVLDAVVVVDGAFPPNYSGVIRSLPPLLAIWGGNDQVFLPSTGAALIKKAKSLGNPARFLTYQNEGHAFFLNYDTTNSNKARNETVQFLKQHLDRQVN